MSEISLSTGPFGGIAGVLVLDSDDLAELGIDIDTESVPVAVEDGVLVVE